MVGYYSHLRLIDVLGLTDPKTARREVQERGMPGHEKKARLKHLEREGVVLLRLHHAPQNWIASTDVDLGLDLGRKHAWRLMHHDPEFIADLKARYPSQRMRPMDRNVYRWSLTLAELPPEQLRTDLAFLDFYYFPYNQGDTAAWIRARAQAILDLHPETEEP